MLNIILVGAKGRMGKTIVEVLKENQDGKRIVAEIDKDCKIKSIEEYMGEGDVVIDFSSREITEEILKWCVLKKTPLVIATTGFLESEEEKIKEASKHIPILKSANMSFGINLIKNMMKNMVPYLEKDFDIEIVEKHHNKKKDAPSGTGILLGDAIKEAMKEETTYLYGRSGNNCERKNEIGFHSVRGGSIPGDHTIIFAGDKETIEISHRAESREIFALGAIKAAEYIKDKEPGLYSMDDLF